DDVEFSAFIELQRDVARRFQPSPELRTGSANPLRNRPDLAVSCGDEGDDAVGFTEFVRAEHDAPVSIERHVCYSLDPPDRSAPFSLIPSVSLTPPKRRSRR